MTYYKSKRPINGKPPIWVIVDETDNIVNRNPNKDELMDLNGFPKENYIDKCRNKPKYTKEQLLDYPIQFYEKHGMPPTARDFVNNSEYPSFVTYQHYFGSWHNALKLVGLDVESMAKKGILLTNQQKARLAEITIRDHFEKYPIDLAGENCNSHCDGICPNGKIYDVKSSKIYIGGYYDFNILNKYREEIELYYLLGFNEDYTKLDYGWRIPGEIAEKDHFTVSSNSLSHREFNVKSMKEYDITEKLTDVLKKYGLNK